MLQAVCASLLQAISDQRIPNEDRDPYGTLVAYFNSLRILGGALVAMQDDVRNPLERLLAGAKKHLDISRNRKK